MRSDLPTAVTFNIHIYSRFYMPKHSKQLNILAIIQTQWRDQHNSGKTSSCFCLSLRENNKVLKGIVHPQILIRVIVFVEHQICACAYSNFTLWCQWHHKHHIYGAFLVFLELDSPWLLSTVFIKRQTAYIFCTILIILLLRSTEDSFESVCISFHF